jgi:hypothetical protein
MVKVDFIKALLNVENQSFHSFDVSLRRYIRISQGHRISLISVVPYAYNKNIKYLGIVETEDGIIDYHLNMLNKNLHDFSIP